jgi:hypothetical protein
MMPMELQCMRSMARAHCAHCSTPGREVYHFDTRCPKANRERPVPCAFATIAEAKAGRHTTFQDDGICDRCLSSRRAARISSRCAEGARGAGGSRPLTAPAAGIDLPAATFSADARSPHGYAAKRVHGQTGPGGDASSSVTPGPVLFSEGMG